MVDFYKDQQPLITGAFDCGKRIRSMIALHADAGIKSTRMALVIEYLHTHQLLLRAFIDPHCQPQIRGFKLKLSPHIMLLLDYLKNKALTIFEQVAPSFKLRTIFYQVFALNIPLLVSTNQHHSERKQRVTSLEIASVTTTYLFQFAFACYAECIESDQLQIYVQIGQSFGICYHIVSVLKINATQSVKLWKGTVLECFTRNQLIELFATQVAIYKQLCTQCGVYNGLFELLLLYLSNQFKEYLPTGGI